MRRLLALIAAALAVATLAGCSTLANTPQVDIPDTRPQITYPTQLQTPRAATGSLYHNASYRPLFEDRRARMAGDTVTINIVETLTASQKSTSTVAKKDSLSAGVTALPFISANSFTRASAAGNSATDFAGKGGTEAANTFYGTITSTVVDVLPNGHLVVVGEKQIGVNQNVDVLRFSGTVDPRAIGPGSVVNSTQVANVRIESRGRGAQGEAQVMPWLSRFFMNVMPF
ncbi:flagellar basal body L-ring protein FlgH [Pseudacidovorax sp. NFM-22]|uniref:flagellar basal body L-ring protein FlgH n=1 Tax=Pseudacidovorax sp. NFM-22 TaxID=2744469 RepID=UPI001F304959|nr:flagellar basal body L-ring protein FlgH [Pseudacidovorax sp. NFM-22]